MAISVNIYLPPSTSPPKPNKSYNLPSHHILSKTKQDLTSCSRLVFHDIIIIIHCLQNILFGIEIDHLLFRNKNLWKQKLQEYKNLYLLSVKSLMKSRVDRKINNWQQPRVLLIFTRQGKERKRRVIENWFWWAKDENGAFRELNSGPLAP